jgi:hypothetical protein
MPPWGLNSFRLGCGGGNVNSAQRSNLYQKFVVPMASLGRVYISSSAPQFERIEPQGEISYDHLSSFLAACSSGCSHHTVSCIADLVFILAFASFWCPCSIVVPGLGDCYLYLASLLPVSSPIFACSASRFCLCFVFLFCQIETLSLTESFIQNVETEYIGPILAL